MRLLLTFLAVSSLLSSSAQKRKSQFDRKNEDWHSGTIYLDDGLSKDCYLRLVVSFNEGTLQVLDGEDILSLSPQRVKKFDFFDENINKNREFHSVKSAFSNRAGSKLVFQELLYQGSQYSLFRRYLPKAKNTGLIIIDIGTFWWTRGTTEPDLFLFKSDDKAYQITKGIKDLSSAKKEGFIFYDIDKSRLKYILGVDYKKLKQYMKKNNMRWRIDDELIEGLKYINGESFYYEKSNTPKEFK